MSVVREDGTVLHKEEIGLRDSMSKRKLLEAKASLRRGSVIGRPDTVIQSGDQRPSVFTVKSQTEKADTGRKRRSRSHRKDRKDATAIPAVKNRSSYPMDQKTTGSSSGKDTVFLLN